MRASFALSITCACADPLSDRARADSHTLTLITHTIKFNLLLRRQIYCSPNTKLCSSSTHATVLKSNSEGMLIQSGVLCELNKHRHNRNMTNRKSINVSMVCYIDTLEYVLISILINYITFNTICIVLSM